MSAFVVPADRPGLSGEHLDMVSPHPIGTLSFDGVPVLAGELLGERDRGFAVAMRTLDLFRPRRPRGAFAVGVAQAALDAAVAHASTRAAFGGLLDQPVVAHLLADMATRTEAARLLVYSAAAALKQGRVRRGGALGHGQAVRGAPRPPSSWWTRRCRSTGHGRCSAATRFERLREVRAPRIYEGASEIQRTIIARELLRRDGAGP